MLLKDKDDKSKFLSIKPTSRLSAYNLLTRGQSLTNMECLPEGIDKTNETLNGFEIAVLKNDLETVKRILDWAKNHQGKDY